MTAVLVSRELLFSTRLGDICARAGVQLRRVDSPADLPPATSALLVLVDWAERTPDWASRLATWAGTAADGRRARVVLFGPHADLEAHAAARAAGLGPMMARSRLLAMLPELLANGQEA